MKRKWMKNPRFTNINTKSHSFLIKCCPPSYRPLSPRKTVESRAHELSTGCRDKPRVRPLGHPPAVSLGVVAYRISTQISTLCLGEKQDKVVTGVKTSTDVPDRAARCLARSRAVGLSVCWTRGPGRDGVPWAGVTAVQFVAHQE